MNKNFSSPQIHPIELPPECVCYIDPDLDAGCSTLTDWASIYGRNKVRDNLLKSPAMNTDSNADGVVDNFTSSSGTGVPTVYSVDLGSQKIDFTAGGTTTNSSEVYQIIPVSPGEVINISCNAQRTAGVNAWVAIDWLNSSQVFIETTGIISVPSTSFTQIKFENKTAPANAAYTKIRFGMNPSSIGSVGSAWFNTGLVVKGSTAKQISDSHLKLTMLSPTLKAGPNGSVLNFDGVDDYAYCPNNSNIDITEVSPSNPLIIGSVCRSTNDTNTGFLLYKGLDGGSNVQYGLYRTSGTKSFVLWLEGNARSVSVANTFLVNKWYFCIFYFDGAKIDCYINNQFLNTSSYALTRLTSRPNFYVGGIGSSGFWFCGDIGVTFMTYGIEAQDVINWSRKVRLLRRYGITS